MSLWVKHQARRASAYASPLPTRFRIDMQSCRVEDGGKHPHLPPSGRVFSPPGFRDDDLEVRCECVSRPAKEASACAQPSTIAVTVDWDLLLGVLAVPGLKLLDQFTGEAKPTVGPRACRPRSTTAPDRSRARTPTGSPQRSCLPALESRCESVLICRVSVEGAAVLGGEPLRRRGDGCADPSSDRAQVWLDAVFRVGRHAGASLSPLQGPVLEMSRTSAYDCPPEASSPGAPPRALAYPAKTGHEGTRGSMFIHFRGRKALQLKGIHVVGPVGLEPTTGGLKGRSVPAQLGCDS